MIAFELSNRGIDPRRHGFEKTEAQLAVFERFFDFLNRKVRTEVVTAGIEPMCFTGGVLLHQSVPHVQSGSERSAGIASGWLREDPFESSFERGDENRVPRNAAAEADVRRPIRNSQNVRFERVLHARRDIGAGGNIFAERGVEFRREAAGVVKGRIDGAVADNFAE